MWYGATSALTSSPCFCSYSLHHVALEELVPQLCLLPLARQPTFWSLGVATHTPCMAMMLRTFRSRYMGTTHAMLTSFSQLMLVCISAAPAQFMSPP